MSMLDARRHRLLAAMGITPWRLRDAVESSDDQTPAESVQRLHIPLTAGHSGSVLEIAGAQMDAPAVHKLLGAMLAAINLDLAAAYPAQETTTVRAVLAFGEEAAAELSGLKTGVAAMRRQWHQVKPNGAALLVTHHPATLLEQKPLKAEAWADLQMLQAALQEPA